MHFKVSTTLKKADTEGRIPPYTLDQYVRSELVQQLFHVLQPTLLINRSDQVAALSEANAKASTVDFTTEIVILKAHQWQYIKETLNTLAGDNQQLLRQVIDEIDQLAYKS